MSDADKNPDNSAASPKTGEAAAARPGAGSAQASPLAGLSGGMGLSASLRPQGGMAGGVGGGQAAAGKPATPEAKPEAPAGGKAEAPAAAKPAVPPAKPELPNAAKAPEPAAKAPEPAKAAPAPKPAAPAKSGGAGGAYVFALLLSAALGGGIYYTWTNPLPAPPPEGLASLQRAVQGLDAQTAQTASQLQALSQQLAGLSGRVDQLEHAQPGQASGDTAELAKRVDGLAAQLGQLAAQPHGETQAAEQGASSQAVAELAQKLDAADAAQKAALAQLTEDAKAATSALAARLDKLEAGAGAVSSNAERAARLTAIEAAVVALEAGQKLGDLPGAPPALARFANVAPPTEAGLRERFGALAAHAREVSRPDLSQKSFWARALTRLQASVTIRQGDEVLVGDPAAGILAEAAEKVRVGDLGGAVASLHRLSGPAAAAMQEWEDQAQALVDARSALANLAAHP